MNPSNLWTAFWDPLVDRRAQKIARYCGCADGLVVPDVSGRFRESEVVVPRAATVVISGDTETWTQH
jgi:hypothetical protein